MEGWLEGGDWRGVAGGDGRELTQALNTNLVSFQHC